MTVPLIKDELVNMTAAELEQWLDTDESRSVGWKGADGQANESVGHASGQLRRIWCFGWWMPATR